jgi:hypothetical protein
VALTARRLMAKALLLLAAIPVIVTGLPRARADQGNDLREFRVGMSLEELPSSGYVGLACAATPDTTLSRWQDFRACPADAAGHHEVRFRYDENENAHGRVNDHYEGTRVGGHPVLLSLLIGEQGRVDGLRITTDPAARLYMHKKAFLLGMQGKARYGEEGWTCTEGQPGDNEQPVGGVFVKERCEKESPSRHFIIERELYRDPAKDLKEFVDSTTITILPPGGA